MADDATYYVTTPIYYVNDVPHIGHAYTTVAADVLARWQRLKGRRVRFLTGVDEHGEKNARAATELGRTPQEHVDAMNPKWRELLDLLGISNDDFIRTTEARHQTAVQRFMQTLYERGDLYTATYSGPYCVRCEAYYTADELVEGLCPIHRRPVETLEQENWFFRLSRYGDALLALYDEHPDFVQPGGRRNEVREFVASGLQDISATRSRFEWGVPVPWEPGHVFYVWFDALLNYITALGYGSDDEALFEAFWPADVQLIGKDIIRFHAVYWPAMLMAAGLPVPRQVFAHGFLLVGGEKMGKSNATGIAPATLVAHFGVDCYRYYFLREISFGHDGTFSWESMESRYTTDLANDLGNLANRVLTMVGSYRGGQVPRPAKGWHGQGGQAEEALAQALTTAADGIAAFDRLDFQRGLADVWALVAGLNRYVEACAPWALNKAGDDEALDRVLYACVDVLRVLAVLLSPVMPGARSHCGPSSACRSRSRTSAGRTRCSPDSWRVVGAWSGARCCSPNSTPPPRDTTPRRSRPALMFTDTHCHLGHMETSPDDIVARAAQAGVDTLVTVGVDLASSAEAVGAASAYEQVWAVVGIHPNNAVEATEGVLERIRGLAAHPRVVGIGETGLDWFRDSCPRVRQEDSFREHIRLAKDLDKALVIHDRDAHDDVVRVLAEEKAPPRTVFHCFSGGRDLVRRCAEEGWFLSFAGTVTFANAPDLRAAAAATPVELLVAETDSPYLSPHPHRGKPNEPARVVHTVAQLAALHDVPTEEMARVTSRNARRLFALPADA